MAATSTVMTSTPVRKVGCCACACDGPCAASGAATRNAARARGNCFIATRILLDAVDLWIPFQAELRGRRHVTGERGGGDDRRAGEIAFAADTHPVLPVPVERRNRTFAVRKCVGALAETGTAPRCTDFAADRSKHRGNRF